MEKGERVGLVPDLRHTECIWCTRLLVVNGLSLAMAPGPPAVLPFHPSTYLSITTPKRNPFFLPAIYLYIDLHVPPPSQVEITARTAIAAE